VRAVSAGSAPHAGGHAGEFDVVVVGGGSAGCVVASRLSEDPRRRVLLLEAGPPDRHPLIKIPAAFPRLFGSSVDWGDRTEPQPELGGRRVYFPRGRVLGGSSSINAMMWVRGLAADYDAWAAQLGEAWGWRSVLPYFHRAEAVDRGLGDDDGLYGRAGRLAVAPPRDANPLTAAWIEAARSLGLPALRQNALDGEGVALALLTQRRGRRHSLADAYLRPARRRPNLAVRTGALVERVVVEGRRACGVAYLLGRRREVALARGEVVVAAGAVGSPLVLLRSGIGPAATLAAFGITTVADSPGVGANLQDHLTTGLVVESRLPATLAAAQSPRQLWRFLTSGTGMLTSNIAEGYGYLRSDAGVATPDLELIFAPVAFLDEGLSVPTVHGMTCAAVLLQPDSRGSVSLRSPDPAAPARIDPRYLSDERGRDATTLAEGVRFCLRVVAQPPLAGLAGAVIQPAGTTGEELVASSVRNYSQTLYHPVGTCAMGRERTSVLDPELRVRGVEGLRVADASAMPTIVRGHTNAATVMLAERASDLLRSALG
jgi:choline dehydrogenase-like flavoprotein